MQTIHAVNIFGPRLTQTFASILLILTDIEVDMAL